MANLQRFAWMAVAAGAILGFAAPAEATDIQCSVRVYRGSSISNVAVYRSAGSLDSDIEAYREQIINLSAARFTDGDQSRVTVDCADEKDGKELTRERAIAAGKEWSEYAVKYNPNWRKAAQPARQVARKKCLPGESAYDNSGCQDYMIVCFGDNDSYGGRAVNPMTGDINNFGQRIKSLEDRVALLRYITDKWARNRPADTWGCKGFTSVTGRNSFVARLRDTGYAVSPDRPSVPIAPYGVLPSETE